MGIFKGSCHGIQCDNCGRVYENPFTGISMMVEESGIMEDAQDHEWLIEDGRCYCPECYEFDDDDNTIIKPKIECELF